MAETIVSGERHYVPIESSPDLRFRFAVESDTGKLSLQVSGDGGEGWQAIASEPPSNAGIGWVPTLGESGKVFWSPLSQIVKRSDQVLPSFLQAWTDFSFPAELQNGVRFGMFEVPKGLKFEVYGAQFYVFSPPSVLDLSVDFINSNTGLQIIGPFSLTAGASYKSFSFPPVLLQSESKTEARINFSGSEFPGSFLVARLLLRGIG